MTFGEGGCWPSRRDELLDAATESRSVSLLADDDERGCWPPMWVDSRMQPPRVVLRVCPLWTMESRSARQRSGPRLKADADLGPSMPMNS